VEGWLERHSFGACVDDGRIASPARQQFPESERSPPVAVRGTAEQRPVAPGTAPEDPLAALGRTSRGRLLASNVAVIPVCAPSLKRELEGIDDFESWQAANLSIGEYIEALKASTILIAVIRRSITTARSNSS
jgi:hypothetical protein